MIWLHTEMLAGIAQEADEWYPLETGGVVSHRVV